MRYCRQTQDIIRRWYQSLIHSKVSVLMCVCVCLCVESVSRSKDYVRSRIKIGSVVCLCTPVSPIVPEMDIPLGRHFCFCFWGCTFGGVNIPCIYSHAGWSYPRRSRSLLLCALSVWRYISIFLPLCFCWSQSLSAPIVTVRFVPLSYDSVWR